MSANQSPEGHSESAAIQSGQAVGAEGGAGRKVFYMQNTTDNDYSGVQSTICIVTITKTKHCLKVFKLFSKLILTINLPFFVWLTENGRVLYLAGTLIKTVSNEYCRKSQ